MQRATITIDLPSGQAWALAELVKRIGWTEIRGNAVDDCEAVVMRDAIEALRKSLAEAGYAPR